MNERNQGSVGTGDHSIVLTFNERLPQPRISLTGWVQRHEACGDTIFERVWDLPHSYDFHTAPHPPCISMMKTKPQRPEGRGDALSSLNMALETLNRTKGATDVKPTKDVFTSASVLLTMIRVSLLPSTLVDCWLIYTGHDGIRNGLC